MLSQALEGDDDFFSQLSEPSSSTFFFMPEATQTLKISQYGPYSGTVIGRYALTLG